MLIININQWPLFLMPVGNMRQYDPSIFVEKPPPPPPTPKVKRQPKSAKKETKEIKTPVDGSKPQETSAKAAKSLGKEKIPAKKKAAKKSKLIQMLFSHSQKIFVLLFAPLCVPFVFVTLFFSSCGCSP